MRSSRPKFRKSGNLLPAIDHEDLNSSTESTISTSLIHDIASEVKSEQIESHGFEFYLPLRGISTGLQDLMVDGLVANVGIGIPIRSSSLATGAPVLMSTRTFVMTQVSNVDLQTRFPVIQIDSMCQVASICRSLALSVVLESLLVDVGDTCRRICPSYPSGRTSFATRSSSNRRTPALSPCRQKAFIQQVTHPLGCSGKPRGHVHPLGIWHHRRVYGSRRGVCSNEATRNLQSSSIFHVAASQSEVGAPLRRFSTVLDVVIRVLEIRRTSCTHG